MNATTAKTTLLATIALIGALIVTGCSPTPTTPEAVEPTTSATAPASPSAEPETSAEPEVPQTPEATVETVRGYEPGATLTEAEVDALKDVIGSGPRAYKLEDGTRVVVQPDKPLPDAVRASEENKLAAVPMPEDTSTSSQSDSYTKADQAAGGAQYATGKKVCVVIAGSFGQMGVPGGSRGWIAAGCGENLITGTDKGSVVGQAQAFIAGQPDAANWDLVVEP